MVFTPDERTSLRRHLIDAAREDPRVTSAALVGSAARQEEDEWSDIDLALQLSPGVEVSEVVDDWTLDLASRGRVVDHLDLRADGALYRVFLLASTLQVDLSFWPHDAFRASGPDFELLFGTPVEPAASTTGNADHHVRLGWLHALHARSAIARRREWQAVWMLEGMRNEIVASACLRHGVPAHQGRGVDRLPSGLRSRLKPTLVTATDTFALSTVFLALSRLLLEEAAELGWENQEELADVLSQIAGGSQ